MVVIRQIDRFLNGITMYRLMLYGLMALAAVAIIFAFMGALSLSGPALLVSLVTLFLVCYAANWLFSTLFDAPTGAESASITAIILFFLLAPPANVRDLAMIALAGLIAMASKYLLATGRKHIFNPAAFGAAAVGLTGLYAATWWVATPILLPFVIALGLLVARKVRRFQLVTAFVLATLATMLLVAADRSVTDVLATAYLSWPLIFLGTIMLTEPATMPPRNRDILIYGALVGVIFGSQVHIGPIYSTPEVALLIGNVFAYFMSPKYRLRLKLKEQVQLSPDITEFRFTKDRPAQFQPGQYMDVLVPHGRTDIRGNRRTFSISSSPTEPELHLTTRFYTPSSSFKTALHDLKPGHTVMAGQLAGNFILPAEPNQKLVFIAGGIGITPFRSMIKHLLDTNQHRDITMFYSANNPSDFVYRPLLDEAKTIGLTTHYLLTAREVPKDWTGETGFLTADIIKNQVPHYQEVMFFLSGPNVMVESYRTMLRQLGIKHSRIKTDYFSGL